MTYYTRPSFEFWVKNVVFVPLLFVETGFRG